MLIYSELWVAMNGTVSTDDGACHYFVMLAIVAIIVAIDDMLCFCDFFKTLQTIVVVMRTG